MATLEKIRSKSVLLIVVIGVALLAFIIGDAITNSRNLFGDHTVVAKIGGDKIDYNDYVRKREEINNRFENARKQNPAQFANFDTQLISQLALDELVGERLIDKAASDAGIESSPELLSFYVLRNPINPRLQEIVQQLNAMGLSVSQPEQAYEVIFNPRRNGLTDAQMAPFQRAWLLLEEETKQMVKRQKYQTLLYGAIKANALDKKALYDDFVATNNVEVAFQPFGQLDSEKYPVSEEEIQNAYNDNKYRFKVEEPAKDAKFIAVSISPSVSDRENAKMLAVNAVNSLSDSIGQLSKEVRKEGVSSTHREMRVSDLTAGDVKDFVVAAAPGEVKLIDENIKGFKIVKMGSRKQAIDSVQLNIVQVAGETLPSKLLAALNSSSLPVDSVVKTFPTDSVFAQSGQWIPLMTASGRTGALDASQLDSLTNAGGKYIAIMESPQASIIAQLVKKNAPVEVVSFDEVSYELKPSTTTVNEERAKLEKFLEENADAASFAENAAKAGYSVSDVTLSSSTAAVPRLGGTFYPDSRQVVRWVMIDGKPGEVSHIYESKDALTPALYAVAVVSEYDDFVPLGNVTANKFATERARRDKAGEELVKKYSPKASSVAAVAEAMGVEAVNDSTFRFGRNINVSDPIAIGTIAGAQPGKVALVKGDNGVYAYIVNSSATESFPYNDAQYEQQYIQFVNPNLSLMLKGAKKLENRIYKFEAGD